MSQDRKLDQICTHEVVNEFLFVQPDRQIVSPIRPISSAATVRLWLNGTVEVPSTGVYASARVVGTREGPFAITSANNVLSLQVNQDPVQTVSLPLTSQITPSRLVSILNTYVEGVVFFTERNSIGIRTEMQGRQATFRVLPASTLAATLGFSTSTINRGKDVFPGWTVIADTATLSDRPRRLIYFDQPLQAASNHVELNYTTVRQECRRCGGIGVENDWRYSTDGQITMVENELLLVQELLKITYTVRNSNPFHPWYGTLITDRIGSKITSSGALQNLISSDIYTTFSRWQSIKKAQEEDVGQEVTDKEFPYRLLKVELEQSQEDPTVLFVNITVQNRSFDDPFTISRGLKLGEPLNLLSDTQNDGIYKKSLRDFNLIG